MTSIPFALIEDFTEKILSLLTAWNSTRREKERQTQRKCVQERGGKEREKGNGKCLRVSSL